MPNEGSPPRGMAIAVGVPGAIRGRLEQRLARSVRVHLIRIARQGGFRLEPPPRVAATLIEGFADEALALDNGYNSLVIVVLPYARLPQEVLDTVDALEGLGATVVRPKAGAARWPSRSPRLDQEFQTQLLEALVETLDEVFPPANEGTLDEEVAFELLRGLAAHSKMGPNNHSHEDDLWKARGRDLGPGGRQRILRSLLASGLVDRKPNDSAGGKGWVYWIADLAQARARFPSLEPYFR